MIDYEFRKSPKFRTAVIRLVALIQSGATPTRIRNSLQQHAVIARVDRAELLAHVRRSVNSRRAHQTRKLRKTRP
jgi:hypothetical protein